MLDYGWLITYFRVNGSTDSEQLRVITARGAEHGEEDLLRLLRAARPQGGHERLRQQEEGQVGGQVNVREEGNLGGE